MCLQKEHSSIYRLTEKMNLLGTWEGRQEGALLVPSIPTTGQAPCGLWAPQEKLGEAMGQNPQGSHKVFMKK